MQAASQPGRHASVRVVSEVEETRAELLVLRPCSPVAAAGRQRPQAPAPAAPAAPVKVSVKVWRAVVVPILMYHHIDVAGPTADAIRQDLSVTPANFAAQMSYLARNGYHTLSLADLVEHLRTGTPLPTSPVVLTFDDGYLDNYTNAFPGA